MNSEKGDKNQNTCARWSCPSAMVTAATGSLWPARATRGCGACPKGGAKRCRLEDKRARSRAVDPQHSRWALEGMSRPAAHGLLLGILELSPRDSARASLPFPSSTPSRPHCLAPPASRRARASPHGAMSVFASLIDLDATFGALFIGFGASCVFVYTPACAFDIP